MLETRESESDTTPIVPTSPEFEQRDIDIHPTLRSESQKVPGVDDGPNFIFQGVLREFFSWTGFSIPRETISSAPSLALRGQLKYADFEEMSLSSSAVDFREIFLPSRFDYSTPVYVIVKCREI